MYFVTSCRQNHLKKGDHPVPWVLGASLAHPLDSPDDGRLGGRVGTKLLSTVQGDGPLERALASIPSSGFAVVTTTTTAS